MGERATGQFAITSWEQETYEETDEGLTLTRATVRKTLQGDFAGESRAEVLLAGDRTGGLAYTALERVVGSIGGRAGSFLLLHGAASEDSATGAPGQIVPGSGTGDLRGLRGTVLVRHDERGATFTLDYDLA